ncbi:solute carrier family 22 member 13-like [Hemicordylus capensis]|uniref:solute carrier family 22 member 13-like n=1 Tax=Hemicordylus capensis TaxID=884348 RepID=UPI0023041D3F|nr:solute carrier family 22 member 13-like [Hemicordylus capensis]
MMEFGEILKVIGEFGRFQNWLVLLICIINLLAPFHMFSQVFVAMDVPHYCNTSWIRAISPNLTTELELNLTLPRKPDGSFEECSMYTPVQEEDIEPIMKYGLNATEKCQDVWVFPTQLKPTLVTELLTVCPWVLPNSACWLLTKGKIKEAKKVLQKAASVNKQIIPEELLSQLTSEEKAKSGNIIDLFKIPHLRKMTLIMAWVWFADSLVYFGLSLQVGAFGLDIYVTQLVFGAVEILARLSCVFLLHWLGRKKCQAAWLFLGGVVCLFIAVIPKDFPVMVTGLAVAGKAALAAAFSTSYVFSAEAFPTVVRQTGLGLCSMSARVAGILSPLAGLLDRYHSAISMVLFGITALSAGILCFFLPETQNKDLQDNAVKSSSRQGSLKGKHR